MHQFTVSNIITWSFNNEITGNKRDTEDRIAPRSVDADDSDVEVKSDDERLLHLTDTSHSHVQQR